MTFTLKVNLFGPVTKNGIIKNVNASITQSNNFDIDSSTYTATQETPTSTVIEGWE
jgi:hypothetical protein